MDRTWDWKVRKQPDYCRPHGERIIIFLNGVGGCRMCCDLLIAELKPDETCECHAGETKCLTSSTDNSILSTS